MSVDLGSGTNTLTLNNATNTGTVKNVGTLLGGTGTDTITLGTVAKNASISLGAGTDTLTFGQWRQHRHDGQRRHDHRPAHAARRWTRSRWPPR